ncbi:hypothetical protein OH786_38560 (plasmid) [Streptomyces atratus]|uniref:hypothetical protein n=1 Tax=Streptomyces atratus TaxID=1893 RepID=UPI0015A62E9F|nr:hypothetical protein [Streptomyces atratus]
MAHKNRQKPRSRGSAAQLLAQPTPDRPGGAIIATTAPKLWEGEPVRVPDLNA